MRIGVLLSCASLAIALASHGRAQAKPVKPNAPKSIEAGLAWLARHQNPDGS